MRLNELGEGKMVAWMQALLDGQPDLKLGIGDDSAVMAIGDIDLVLTSDILLQDTHIYKGMTPYQAGMKVATCNFSDLAAMGARPRGFLLSIGTSPSEPAESFKDIVRGASSVCKGVGATYAGGDMTSSEKLILSGFAFGTSDSGRVLTRKGASPGDILAITGHIGSSACGWQILQNKGIDSLDVFSLGERKAIEKKILKATLEPVARVKEGLLLADSGFVTSCIDVSDGLAVSLKHMQDNNGFVLDESAIPVEPEVRLVCERLGLDYEKTVYHVGEDFELLFTVKSGCWDELAGQVKGITKIGEVTSKGIDIKRADGKIEPLDTGGYDHFSA